MEIDLTQKAKREIEEMWQLRIGAVHVLGLIVAEWQSDPQSTQCFDKRIIDESKHIVNRLKELEKHAGMF